ncbi:MAG TPA: hypothetical protein VFZ41_08155 [Solirubrobacterales bacterium]
MKHAKRIVAAAAAAAVMAIAPANALGHNADAPGKKIKSACGMSFGQLVSGGKKTGTAFHTNYAGGAKAFSQDATLAAHGCNVNNNG